MVFQYYFDLFYFFACPGRVAYIGHFRAFLVAGVPSVVVSLWDLPDDSTSDLMVFFYEELLEKKNKAVALRNAMLKCKKVYPHPVYWAAFTLVGSFLQDNQFLFG